VLETPIELKVSWVPHETVQRRRTPG